MIPFEATPQVWGIYGNLGGGKTLTAVSMALSAFFKGYFVVSNIDLNIGNLSKYCPYCKNLYKKIDIYLGDEVDENGICNPEKYPPFRPFSLPAGSPRGSGGDKRVVVIIDECAEWLDQYANLKHPVIRQFFSWLRHTSKRGQDVVLICQRREYLCKSARILISRWVYCEDLRVYRLPVIKARVPFMGDFCFNVIFDKALQIVRPLSFVRKTFIGQFYDTSQNLSVWGQNHIEYSVPSDSFDFPLFLPLLSAFFIVFLFFWFSFVF